MFSLNKAFFLIIFTLSFWGNAQDREHFDQYFNWSGNLVAKKMKPSSSSYKGEKTVISSMCYETEQGKWGINSHKPMRIASLSKIYTSYWALKELGQDYRFSTQVFYHKDTESLTITSDDLLFNREHIYWIIKKLNERGIHYLKKIYINENISWIKRDGAGSWKSYSVVESTKRKQSGETAWSLFNTEASTFSSYYKSFQSWLTTVKEDIDFSEKSLQMEVSQIEFVSHLDIPQSYDFYFKISSKKLIHYLKILNTYSHNELTDRLFNFLGGRVLFHDFIYEDLETNEEFLSFFTGSGYNLNNYVGRHDNYSTCDLTLKVMKKIDSLLRGLALEDILAYGGRREGSLKYRFKSKDTLAKAISAKTGTLSEMPISALGGVMGLDKGKSYFTIINQFQNSGYLGYARSFQELMLDKMGKIAGICPFTHIQKEELTIVRE